MKEYTDTKLISVIIPVYNRSQELQRSIKSVLTQTHQHFEIIVVDDGSEEDIKTVCNKIGDNRIRFYKNQIHSNANVARNRGIKEAKGEYIAMLDSDDEFLPIHLQRRLQKILEWNCDGIFGSTYIFDGIKKILDLSRPLTLNESMADYLLGSGSAKTPTHFYKRSAVLKILWDESLKRHQDYDFSIRFAKQFDFKSDYEPTAIVNWTIGEKRVIDFKSNIEFIEKYKNICSPFVLSQYFFHMYKMAKNEKDSRAIKYYKNELKKRVSFTTLSQWIDISKESKIAKSLTLLRYISYLIFRL